MAAGGQVRIGTSGWHYAHWRGPFYPTAQRPAGMLAAYADAFDTVEVNSSFYAVPKPATVQAWRHAVPPGFVFAVKANRFITHMKKLRDPVVTTRSLLQVVSQLGDRLGPLLFQLPPRWRADPGRLDGLLAALPAGRRCAVECRDADWFRPSVYAVLARHGAALCFDDFGGRRVPEVLTADFVYLRLHGPAGPGQGPYQGRYDGRTLNGMARRIRRWAGAGHDVYGYFDNDQAGHAPRDALRLKAMLARSGKSA